MNKFINCRQKAIQWLNSNREFYAGITILEESNFKPGVVRKLRQDGPNHNASDVRLYHLMMQLVNAWSMSEEQINDETDPVTGLRADSPVSVESLAPESITRRILNDSDERFRSPLIKEHVALYAKAIRMREKYHVQLGLVPEENDERTIAQRKHLIQMIDECTDTMEHEWPIIKLYVETGMVDQSNKPKVDAVEHKEAINDNHSLDDLSSEELQKMVKNLRIRIVRTKNMLLYQQNTKLDKPNPMPQSPSRVKYEKRLEKLNTELEQALYAIAKRT